MPSRARVLGRIREWVAAEHVYAWLMTIRAQLQRSRLQRADILLRGVRPVGARNAGPYVRRVLNGVLQDSFYENGALQPLRANRLLSDYQQSGKARAIRSEFNRYSVENQARLRTPIDENDSEREGDVIILKSSIEATGEKGVLLISYTEPIRQFAAVFDVAALSSRYTVVLEPSWWGYEDVDFLLLAGSDMTVVVQSSWQRDYEFIQSLSMNLKPIRIGAGQWMDSELFRPPTSPLREYDLVMVSSWSPFKRHSDLFEVLAEFKREQRPLHVVLIGYPDEWTKDDIVKLMRKYDVEDCCTVFQGIPHAQVAQLVGNSRAYVLLSRREGSNRALYEAMFCDTPVVVYSEHRGVNSEHVNAETGVRFEDGCLKEAIRDVLSGNHAFQPRAWALAHAGFLNCTRQLNDLLRADAASKGEPWTVDITPKFNGPNPSYLNTLDRHAFDSEYEKLEQFLLTT